MATPLQTMVNLVKRTARFGASGNNADQPAADIVEFINNWRFKIWRFWNWDWTQTAISFTLPANTTDYTLPATIGQVDILSIQGQTGYLTKFTKKRYQQWIKNPSTSATDDGPVGYLDLGRDASGNIKLRFVNTATADVVIEGFGKTRISRYVVADIATVTQMEFFPDEMLDLIYEGALSDAYEEMQDERAKPTRERVLATLNSLVRQVASDGSEEVTSPPPDMMIWRARNRGGSKVV